jgi:hypothetical protein
MLKQILSNSSLFFSISQDLVDREEELEIQDEKLSDQRDDLRMKGTNMNPFPLSLQTHVTI